MAKRPPTVEFHPVYQDLFRPFRYKIYWGGRGGGKSWAIARALVLLGANKKLRILCAREIQHSIADSVHKLLSEQIYELNLESRYHVTKNAILGKNGTEFIFKGLRFNVREVKSTEGIDICWVEEAQSVSEESWSVLIPTVRKANSEIWLSFNPLDEDDPTYQRFILHTPPNAAVHKVGFRENPWFPDVLRQEMEYLKRVDYEAYLHVWEGEVRRISDAIIFKDKFVVEPFETPDSVRFYHGADWGFACLVGETMVITEKGNKQLKDVKPGDKVLTRDGYKAVIHAQSRGVKSIYGVDCGYNTRIIATEDHRILTADGWRQVKDLRRTETLCITRSNLTARFIKGILTVSTRIISTGNSAENANTIAFTEQSGNFTTAKFQKAVTFIISTATRLITALRICSASQKANIKKFITKINSAVYQKKSGGAAVIQKKTGQSEERKHLQPHKNGAESAQSAGSLSRLQTFTKNFALRNVGNTRTPATAKRNTLANGAVKFLQRLLTAIEKPVLKNVRINLQSLGEAEVFDITVENGEYFANGVLVHNCDPTALVRCFIKDRRLYVDMEAYGVGVELDETGALFDAIPTARKWPIKADSARPETISYMKRAGFNITAARKWQGSVEDGIAFMKSFEKIVLHPRCKHAIDEFGHYSYKVDKQTNDVLPIIVDANNHCIARGTLVSTERGNVPIEQVCAGDKVYTRDGLRLVTASIKTGDNRAVVEVQTATRRVICTPDHKIFVVGRGFVEAGELKAGDELVCLHSAAAFAQEPVLRVTPLPYGAEVYDLTVNGEHEFFANGILVHNCIDALRYALDGEIKGRGPAKQGGLNMYSNSIYL